MLGINFPFAVRVFARIGQAIGFLTNPAVQLGLMAAQGIQAHRTNKKLKKGQEILLTKYGTGDGIPVIYGTRRAAGTVVFMETVNQKELFVVYAIAVGEVDDIDDLRIDGRSVSDTSVYRQGFTLRKEGNYFGGTVASENTADIANVLGGANSGDNPRMVFNIHHGSSSQEADPMLFHVFDGSATSRPDSWTADHKLSGIAYIAANFEYDTQGMFTGIPNLTARVKGKKVLDTRTSATGYSSNPAMCLRDYLTNDEYGKGIAAGDLDATSFNTAANDCDSGVQTISHTSVPVLLASTVTDRVKLQNESDFNKIKTGTTIAFASGGTTYFSGRVLDKDSTIFREEGDSATSYGQHYYLLMDEGAVTTAITSTTSGTITETQPRFECHAVIDTDETVLENTKDLIANMRGIFTYTNGTYSLDVEGTESSVVSLDEDDILESGLELSLENKEQKYNKVEVEFYNSSKKYEADTVVVTDGLSDDGNEVLEHRAQFPFVTNQRVAYNHAEAILNRSRNNRSVTFVATPKVLKARVGEVITITSADLNLSAEPYRITQMNIMPDLNIQVSAVEYQASIYGWQDPPAEDIGSNPTPPDPFRVVKPTSLAYTAKNTTTGEPAKLTWSDSTEYPSFEFRVQILSDSSSKTRFDKRVKATEIYLDGINIDTGFVAKVSAINSLGTESDPVELTFAVTTAPITTVDIGQGSIGGFSFDATKMYHGTGTFNNTNTAVYFDNTGQLSLKDKLSWNGTTLNISGNLTVENTINANKIVLDGNNLADLFSSTSSGVNSTISTNSKIQRFNWVDGTSTTHYGLYIDNTGTYGQIGIGTVSQPSDAIHVYNSGARLRLETASGGYVRVKGSGASMELEAGNTGSGYDNSASILLDISGNDVAKFHALGGMELPSLTPSTTTNRLYQNSGTLFWNGNQVGVGAITSVTNMADNRMITASGSNSLNGEANMTFDGTTLALTGNQTISGNLTVSGTTTTIDTTNLDVKDKNITLNYGSGDTSANANGAGITIQDAVSASTDATILWDSSNDEFDFSHKITTPSIQASGASTIDELTVSNDTTLSGGASFGGDASFGDNNKAKFGAGNDLQIYHNGSNSFIDDAGTGNLFIDTAGFVSIRDRTDGQTLATFNANSDVQLFHNGTARLATTSSGVSVTGSISSGNITTSGSSPTYTLQDSDGTNQLSTLAQDGGSFILTARNNTSNGNIIFKGNNGSSVSEYGRFNSSGNFSSEGNVTVGSALKMGSTIVIDSSRNLTNIGTISSGAITTPANINISGTSGKYQINSLDIIEYSGGHRIGAVADDDESLTLVGFGGQPNIVLDDSVIQFKFSTSEKMRLDSSGRLGIGTNAPSHTLDVIGNVEVSAGIFVANGAGISQFSCNHATSSADDWQISPISIRERGLVGSAQSANSYSPNINFHWASRVSRSLTMLADGSFVLGEWTASGSPETTANLSPLNTGGYRINGTDVITSSRNLTNIGTISSGAITAVGTIYSSNSGTDGGQIRLANSGGGSTFYWAARTTGLNLGELGAADGRIFVKNGGNVGIGYTAPNGKLNVAGRASINCNWAFNDAFIVQAMQTNSTAIGAYRTDGTTPIFIAREDGKVGIGTSSPDTKLHIVDALSGGQLLVATSESDNAEKYGTFGTQHYDVDQEPVLAIAAQSSSSENNILIGGALGEFNAATSVKFFTAANATTTTGSERMRINSSGNVGIGTGSPSQKLDVQGSALINGDVTIGAADSANRTLTIAGGASGNDEGGEIRLATAADHDGTYDFYRIDAHQDDLRIGRAGQTDLTLNSSGSVGIATTSPSASYKLDVNGKIRSQQEMLINTGSLFVNQEGEGIHLMAPNGTEYKITVSNAGALVITEQ